MNTFQRVVGFVQAGVERDGDNSAVIYGYGRFEISQTPSFRRYALPFLERGGAFAEAWHHAAREERKQNTFDDFVAAAMHLADKGYTRPERLGI